MVVVVLFRLQAAEHGNAGAHHIHRVRRGGQLFQRSFHRRRHAAQRAQLGLVTTQFTTVGELAVHQQIRDLFEFAAGGQVQNVVTTVVQIVAAAPTVHSAVLPAAVPDRATDFFGLKPGMTVSFMR